MGKRSSFTRFDRDYYVTPYKAVLPLLPHLVPGTRFDEPCCGNGALIQHLWHHGHTCVAASDICPVGCGAQIDALHLRNCSGDCFVTNPPWSRPVLHQLIPHLSGIAPTWLLFDADWAHTKQAVPYMPLCSKIVSVGRLKWIPGSKGAGKDNCAWYRFDRNNVGAPAFFGWCEGKSPPPGRDARAGRRKK